MTSTLIVLAHPAPTSFNSTWARATEEAAVSLGHSVLWSDLYAMGFDPAERSALYRDGVATDPYDVLKTQEAAAATGALPEQIEEEIAKIRQADRIVFHFPIWWFQPPAMLKGWCERVLVNGGMHDTGNRFDTGRCRGKSALFCVTTGSKATESAFNGKEGDIRLLLWPLAYTLRYLGFTVLEPKVISGIHGYHKGDRKQELEDRLGSELSAHRETIARFETLPRLSFNSDDEFDGDGRLLPDAPSHSPFIRHEP